MALKTVLKNTLDKWGILSVEMQQAMLSDQAVVIEKDGNLTNSYEDVPEFTVISKEEERLEAMIINMSDAELPALRASLSPEMQIQFDDIVKRNPKATEAPKEEAPVIVVTADETKKPSEKKAAAKAPASEDEEFKQRVKAMDENTMGDYNSVQAIENTSGITDQQKAYLQKYLDEMLTRG
jgi:recombinational DNA repair protein RecT